MYFGKYLLDQKIITTSHLIEGMAAQFESQPSLLRLLSSSGFLKDEQIVDLIGETLSNNKSLVETIIEKNILDEKKIGQLLDERTARGLGLGQTLIKLGYLEISEFDIALKKYTSTNEQDNSSYEFKKKSTEIKTEEPERKKEEVELNFEPEISKAALESLKELGISNDIFDNVKSKKEEVNTEIVEVSKSSHEDFSSDDEIENKIIFHGLNREYLNLFNKKLCHDFTERISKMIKDFDYEILESFHRDLSLLHGASRLANLEYSEKMLHCYCKVIEKVIEKNVTSCEFDFMNFSAMFEGAIKLIFELREEVINNSSEEALINNKVWRKKFLQNLKEVLLMIKEKRVA
ncbi:MAG: hypothetical protein HN576_05680 [Bacteriovoracaceae bacterium]|nr:hypothetical protein [Bacteriovoracaceae bacterium]